MKITIDTDNKTLEIVNEITIKELNKFIDEFKLQDYRIIPKYNISLYNGSYPQTMPCDVKPFYNPQYPTITC